MERLPRRHFIKKDTEVSFPIHFIILPRLTMISGIRRLIVRLFHLLRKLVGLSVSSPSTETAALVDYNCFPHIWDTIVNNAPPESLAVLTRVSRESRRHALSRFTHLYGLYVSAVEPKPRIKAALSYFEGTVSIPLDADHRKKIPHILYKGDLDGRILRLSKLPSDVFNNVEVIDVGCCGAETKLRLLAIPSLRVVRIRTNMTSTFWVPPTVTTVVISGILSIDFIKDTSIDTLVIVFGSLPESHQCMRLSKQIKNVVIICFGDQRDYLMNLWPLLEVTVRIGAQLTLVGSSPSTEPWDGPEALAYSLHNIGIRIWQSPVGHHVRTSGLVTHQDEKEFRAEVGEDAWALYSNVPLPLRCDCTSQGLGQQQGPCLIPLN